jgi:hypothetical protein
MIPENLRAEFLRLLTTDIGEDARRRGFNQAIFAPEDRGGYAIWNGTNLDMVMSRFDKAIKAFAK